MNRIYSFSSLPRPLKRTSHLISRIDSDGTERGACCVEHRAGRSQERNITGRRLQAILLVSVLLGSTAAVGPVAAQAPAPAAAATGAAPAPRLDDPSAAAEEALLSDIRQLTFAGRRAGEGYFSADGRYLVFQSEREPDNPFFQIYLMDRETGDVRRISPGIGKTTCAWIHPSNKRVLYASTQDDPRAVEKQRAEIEFRESGQQRRYTWDYDPMFDLVEYDLEKDRYTRLTTEMGYDAEGSYSPDGQWICFASNRRGYTGELEGEEAELFEDDPAVAMELYLMRADGTQVQRLTDAIGYDGGPFFSPDGRQICWRRFSKNGATAEIMLMNRDGSDQRAITHLGAMSWAPFFHPSGEYLIFATNIHGFSNFELYMVRADGRGDPVRVTNREGFDGLPAFSPDGRVLVWTSNAGGGSSQLFEARWNDAVARRLLGLETDSQGADVARRAAAETDPDFSPADVGRHVDFLCRPELGGRLTGTPGEQKATAYVAAYLESLGLVPAGPDGSFFHPFEFVSDVQLGPDNTLHVGESRFEVDRDWRPVFFSREGSVDPTPVVCAGYGIVAPAEEDQEGYDSYVHLDVKDKWVMVFRGMPGDIPPERRQHLARYSGPRYKAMVARDRGATGLIFVSGPTSQYRSQLIPLSMDGTLGGSSIAVISVTDPVAEVLVRGTAQTLREIQTEFDDGHPHMGFLLPEVTVAADIDIEPVTSQGRNVLARLPAGSLAAPPRSMVVVGAHIDHLGQGSGGGSLAREDERGGIHRGADDNASGVAAMLEIAQYFAHQTKSGELDLQRDLLFAAWSGEELGLRGSQAFADDFDTLFPATSPRREPSIPSTGDGRGEHPHRDAAGTDAPHAATSHPGSLYPRIAACVNLDMVGRLRDKLILQGIGSSPDWTSIIERRNAVVRLPLTLQNDCYLPTDASTFFLRGVPILSAFTGSHAEYHTPRDVPELLNYEGAARIARLMALIVRDLATADHPPQFSDQPAEPQVRANMTAFLGTIPDYSQEDVQGVPLSGVTKGAPADLAGIRGGDVVVELAGRKIENIYDYTYAIEALKVGQPVTIKVRRGDSVLALEVTPASRQ